MSTQPPGTVGRTCPKCGYPLAAWEDTCSYCGFTRGVACTRCGEMIPPRVLFCPQCGSRTPVPSGQGGHAAPPAGPPAAAAPPAQTAPAPPQAAHPPSGEVPGQAAPVQGAGSTTPHVPISDPIESLAQHLGITYIRAKRIYDEGLSIDDLQRMRTEKVVRIVGDEKVAEAIKQRVGHIHTAEEMEEVCYQVTSDVDALIAFAERVSMNMDEMKRALEYLRAIFREKRIKEAIEYAEKMQKASIAFHQEAVRRARREIEHAAKVLEGKRMDAAPLTEAIAKIDVALSMSDYSGARRSALTALETAQRMTQDISRVETDLRELKNAAKVAMSLGIDPGDAMGDLDSAERHVAAGDFKEAVKVLSRCRKVLESILISRFSVLTLQGKRRLLEMKLAGQDIHEARALLESAKAQAARSEMNAALTSYMRFMEISSPPDRETG